VRPEFRGLQGYGDVGVAGLPAFFGQETDHAAKQVFAVGTLPKGGIVGEMEAYVAEGGGAEQCVAEGMDGHIAVGVGHESCSGGNLYASEPHREPFRYGVNVVSLSDSYLHNTKVRNYFCIFVNYGFFQFFRR
jgi:hypothetical protein